MRRFYWIQDAAAGEPALLRQYAEARGLVPDGRTPDGPPPDLRRGDRVVYAASSRPSADLLEALLLHVLEGGGLLFLGGGVTCTAHELTLLMGARFLRELPYGELSVLCGDSPLTAGFTAEALWDRALILERSAFDNAQVLLSMVVGRQTYPLVWRRDWYLGQVFVMATALPGPAREAYAPVLYNILDAMGGEG